MKINTYKWRAYGLALLACLVTFQLSFANDVIIEHDNGVASSNGSFVGNTWTPTGSPSILSYTDLIAQLNIGDVIIGTGATPGSISFAEFLNSDEGILGYDFAANHTLTLMAEGDITIDGFGIAPVSPANTGKLNINIVISGADHDLLVQGGGISTNGGNVMVSGATEVSINQSKIDTRNNLMERGSLTIDQGKVTMTNGTHHLADVMITSTELFTFMNTDLNYTGQIIMNAQAFALSNGSIQDYSPISASNRTVHLTAVDLIDIKNVNFNTKDELKFTTKDLLLTESALDIAKGMFIIDASGEVTLSSGDIDMFGATDAADVDIKADDLCVQNFSINARETDNQSDFNIEANTISLLAGSITGENALDGRTFTVEAQQDLNMDAFSIYSSYSDDANISLKAVGSLLLNDSDKDQDCETQGNGIYINEGNGTIELAAEEIFLVSTGIYIYEGNGKIALDGTEKIDLYTSSIYIDDDGKSDLAQNEITLNTKVLKNSATGTYIYSEGVPGILTITATDTLISKPQEMTACLDEAYGGGSFYIYSDDNVQAGTIEIEAGYTYLEQTGIYTNALSGDVTFVGSDSLRLYQSEIRNGSAEAGNLSVTVSGNVFLTNAGITRSFYANGTNISTGDLTVTANSILYPFSSTYDPSADDQSNAAIYSNVQSGDLTVMAIDEISFTNGSIYSTQEEGDGAMMVSAQKIDLKEACIYMQGSTGELKVQAEDLDMMNADMSNRTASGTNSGPLLIAGNTLDMMEAAFSSNGKDITISFMEDITMQNSGINTNGGNMSALSLEGAINMDDSGVFTSGGNLSLTACSGIDAKADLYTGGGTGGSFTSMGSPISSIPERRSLGTGNISLKISDDCTDLMVSIEDPCDCENPDNIYNGTTLEYFNEVVTISGANDDTWVLMDIVGGAIYDANGVEITDLSTITPTSTPNGNMTDFTFTFWHEPGVGYDAIFEATAGTSIGQRQFIANSCDGTICERVVEDLPAIPMWSLLLMGLLLLSLSIFLLGRNSSSVTQ